MTTDARDNAQLRCLCRSSSPVDCSQCEIAILAKDTEVMKAVALLTALGISPDDYEQLLAIRFGEQP